VNKLGGESARYRGWKNQGRTSQGAKRQRGVKAIICVRILIMQNSVLTSH